MQYDYYAFRKEQLENPLSELEQAKKQKNNKDARQQAERKIEQAAAKAVQIEPHLAYFWFWSKKEESDKEAERAVSKTEKKQAQEEAKLNSEAANSIRDAWRKHLTANSIPSEFQFLPKLSDLDRLPSLSFMLRVPFKLRKPYLSKDDRAFHLLDNPVRKDKVFQTPMVASTSWKGALRATLWQLKSQKEIEINDKDIERLFGNERGEENHQNLKSGRLYFYPTFFDKIGLEVINPHDRKKGTSKRGPIPIECVPIGATGELVILYVPFGKVQESEVAEDLELVAEGVQAMLMVYGFGAKTSSGFGVAEVEGKGALAIRADLPDFKQLDEPEVKQAEPELPRYLIAPGQIDPGFLNADGSFKSKVEYIQGKSAKKAKQFYDKAKKWWDSEQLKLTEATETEPIPEPEPLPKSTFTEVSFDKLSELGDRAQEISQSLTQSRS